MSVGFLHFPQSYSNCVPQFVQYFFSMLSVPHMHRTILYNQIISICSAFLNYSIIVHQCKTIVLEKAQSWRNRLVRARVSSVNYLGRLNPVTFLNFLPRKRTRYLRSQKYKSKSQLRLVLGIVYFWLNLFIGGYKFFHTLENRQPSKSPLFWYKKHFGNH